MIIVVQLKALNRAHGDIVFFKCDDANQQENTVYSKHHQVF